jgi:pimeloyl-ACP methyl ester carboxylesterase
VTQEVALNSGASILPVQHRIATNGIVLDCLERGEGTPLLMLHGFPDHAASWRPLAERLGPDIRQLAPDQRGYRGSSRPGAVSEYAIDTLVRDLLGLIDALDIDRVYLCGHDWGGVLAFEMADRFPDRIAGLIALNAPPARVLQHMILHDAQQRAASQYITVLRSEAADSIFCAAQADALIERFLGDAARRGLLTSADLEVYRDAWTKPGAWSAMRAWYRAAPFEIPAVGGLPAIDAQAAPPALSIACPVLIIWGDRDTVFVPTMPDMIANACPQARVIRLPDAGHVPHRDAPALCARLIRDFIFASSAASLDKDRYHG